MKRIYLALLVCVSLALPPLVQTVSANHLLQGPFRGGFRDEIRPGPLKQFRSRPLVHDGTRIFLNCQACHRTSQFGFPLDPVSEPVWVAGFWGWNGFQWVWVPGHWAWGP